jgi:diguanylate cyclase (GGDEF)-like protein/PAS domain S-box-containing protein
VSSEHRLNIMPHQKQLILAIDDNPANLLMLGKALQTEFELQVATSGQTGLALAARTQPDLILLDIMMPEMDGFEVCRRLKADPVLKDIPVVFISANTTLESESVGLALGAVDYITKPINVDITRQRIRNLLERERLRKDLMVQRDLLSQRVSELDQVTIALLSTQATLADSEAFKRTILNSLPHEIVVLDAQGVIQSVNEPWQRFAQENPTPSGVPASHTDVGSNYLEVCRRTASTGAPEAPMAAEVLAGIEAVMAGTLPGFSVEYPCHSATEQRWFRMMVSPLQKAKANWVVISHANVTERTVAQNKLVESEAHLRTIILNEPECIKIVDAEGRLVQMNPAGLAMIEADSLAQVQGQPVLNVIAPEHQTAFANLHQRVMAGESGVLAFEVQGLKGGRRWLETHAVPMQDQGQTVQLAVTRDITERKLAEAQIHHLAFYDPLTNLPNRRLLHDRLRQTLAAFKRNKGCAALMFMDMDNFKPLNDRHGHAVGDLLLMEVAQRLSACVRQVDTVARFGGDEFVVMLSELDTDKTTSTTQALAVAEKIRLSLADPYLLTLHQPGRPDTRVEHHCTASIGVVVFDDPDTSVDDVLKWADAAMYLAKEAGRNLIRFH